MGPNVILGSCTGSVVFAMAVDSRDVPPGGEGMAVQASGLMSLSLTFWF